MKEGKKGRDGKETEEKRAQKRRTITDYTCLERRFEMRNE